MDLSVHYFLQQCQMQTVTVPEKNPDQCIAAFKLRGVIVALVFLLWCGLFYVPAFV